MCPWSARTSSNEFSHFEKWDDLWFASLTFTLVFQLLINFATTPHIDHQEAIQAYKAETITIFCRCGRLSGAHELCFVVVPALCV